MRQVHLAPRFKLWLILGTTAALIITALLALMLAWGPRPAVETQSAAMPFAHPSASGFVSGPLIAQWPNLTMTTAILSGGFGAGSNSNQPVLALSSGVALALSVGALWVARRRRNAGALDQASAALNTPAKVSPAASL